MAVCGAGFPRRIGIILFLLMTEPSVRDIEMEFPHIRQRVHLVFWISTRLLWVLRKW